MTKNRRKIKYLVSALLVVVCGFSQAQERLFDLNVNYRLSNYDEYLKSTPAASRASNDTLDLPFFDDFSEPFSRRRTIADDYPDPDLWDGNTVYINNHMAINPISQGVATFDGLDENGRAYSFGTALPALSDSLTSSCIRLQGAADTVILSFFYQAQGLGNAPEEDDLLVLEFKDTSSTWNPIWEAEGYILEDFDFHRVMIPVTDTAYLFDGFQFRFRNYASRSGNVDHWHIDYVELDDGRSMADTLIDDLAFMGQTSMDYNGLLLNATSSVLKDFNNMPWTHFTQYQNRGDLLGDSTYFCIRNSAYESSPGGRYTLQIYNAFGTLLHTGVEASPNVFPNVVCGNEPNTCAPIVQGEQDLLYDSIEYQLPIDLELTPDSMFFEIVHNIDGLDDEVPTNDRTSHDQLFYNYYAYDDGTAEAAYGLGELENVGRVAVKYNVKMEDDLRAIQLYLNPVEFDLSQELVQLAIWNGNEEPDQELWTSEPLYLNYTGHINYFYHYFLDTLLTVSDNIWVGWIQQPATNLKFSVGFDKRSDHSDKAYYNLGTTWSQSSIPGSIMIRPVFGQAYDWVGVKESNESEPLKIFPNPSNGTVHIQERFAGQLSKADIRVFDLSGRAVYQQVGYYGPLRLDALTEGIYILRIDAASGIYTNRLVLQ